MAFSADFLAIANDPNEEALRTRVLLRADTDAGSNQLITITAPEIDVSPIIRRRELEWGVVQGQEVSVTFVHEGLEFNPSSPDWITTELGLTTKWAAVQVGFPDADEWETVAQGRIESLRAHTNLTATMTFHDPIMDVLERRLRRDQVFDDRDAWCSALQVVVKSSSSSYYDNSGAPPAITAAVPATDVVNETFRIVFVNGTQFDVYYEDGTTQAGGPFNISADRGLTSNTSSVNVATIYTAGWTGTYAAGDEFVLYVSKQYAAGLLVPSRLIEEILLENGVRVSYDVLGGATQSLFYDPSHWDDVEAFFSSSKVRGYWTKGTRVIDMIQDLLKVMNASLYPTPTGQIAIWHLAPEEVGATTGSATGDPEDPEVSILEAERIDSSEALANVVQWEYLDMAFAAGQDGQAPAIEPAFVTKDDLAGTGFEEYPGSSDPLELHRSVRVSWAVDDVTIDAAATRLLNRYKVRAPTFRIRGSISHVLEHDIVDAVSITEPVLSEFGTKILVTEVGLNAMANEAELIGYVDPVVSENYARVGISVVDGADKVF